MKIFLHFIKPAFLITAFFACSESSAQQQSETFVITITKTIDGSISTKEETVTVKKGESVDAHVRKHEEEFTKDDKEKGKKVKVEVRVESKDGQRKKETRALSEARADKTSEPGTYKLTVTKTVDGKETVKEETITLKEKENLESIVNKHVDEFTKDDKEQGKKVELKVHIVSKEKPGRKVTREEKIERDENGKEIRRENRVIITDEE